MHKLHTNISSLKKSQKRRAQEATAAFHLKEGAKNRDLVMRTAKEALCGFQCPGNCGNPIVVSARVTADYAGQVELKGCCEVGIPVASSLVNERLKM